MPGKGRVAFQGYQVYLIPRLNHLRKTGLRLAAVSLPRGGGSLLPVYPEPKFVRVGDIAVTALIAYLLLTEFVNWSVLMYKCITLQNKIFYFLKKP